MDFIDMIKGVWRRMFPLKNIKKTLGVNIALSEDMAKAISKWYRCYIGNAKWCQDDIISLRLEKGIVREFANIVLNEMTTECSNDKLNDIFHHATRRLNKYLQRGLATGAFIAKPLGADKVQYLAQHEYIPIEFDSEGKPTDVIFPDIKIKNGKRYTRLERHTISIRDGLTVQNTAFVANSKTTTELGREIPLTAIDEWANILAYVRYPDMKKIDFGYYSNPVDNTIDGSACGVSIFADALSHIKKADIQAERLDWEFKSGERAIHASEEIVRKDGKLSKGKDRLYRAVDLDEDASINNLIQDFSPDFRQEDIIAGLENIKRDVEFTVGLAYGDLSKHDVVEKTATEIEAARTRKYNTVTAIQENLEECLSELMYALAFYNALVTSNYSFSCSFKDSILADEEAERKQDIQDMSNGIMRKEEYRAKWYGEDIETALSNLPESAEVFE